MKKNIVQLISDWETCKQYNPLRVLEIEAEMRNVFNESTPHEQDRILNSASKDLQRILSATKMKGKFPK